MPSPPTDIAIACRLCGSALSSAVLDFGPLPACNRFTAPAASPETLPLVVRSCRACGLIQLETAPPPSFLVPRVPWIRYREPEAHLDDLVERLRTSRSAWLRNAIGTGPFDAPLTDRLGRHGVTTAQLPLPASDGMAAYPYLETIQDGLEPAALGRAAERLGTADLVCCRYLLEHCHRPVAALAGLGQLAGPDGAVLVEVPDSTKFLARRDYSFIWEEHASYFTEATLRAAATHAGFEIAELIRYEGVLEDALVAILQPMTRPAIVGPDDEIETGNAAFADYAAAFASVRAAYRARLAGIVAGGGKVGLLGAGHQAIMFVNALGLQRYIAVVADDDPNKQGYCPAGLAVPIQPSSAIAADPEVSFCLLAVGPGAEAKVRTKLADFTGRGGVVLSIFEQQDPRSISAGTA